MDLNHRPPGPEPGALARLRYAPTALILPLLQKAQTKAIDLPDPIRDALARLRYAPTALILPLLQKAQTKAIDLPDPIRDALARLRYAPTDTLGSVLPPQARLSD